MIKVTDILTLTGAGFSLAEIKAFGSETAGSAAELIKGGIKKDDVPEYLDLMNAEETCQEPETQHAQQEETHDDPDYKAMYEALKAEQQKKATHKDVSGNQTKKKSSSEILTEIYDL